VQASLAALRFFTSSQVIQNIAILGSGTALAQAINVAATPLLAALYGPDSFGMMAIFMGIVLVAGTLASLTYESAIVVARDNLEAEKLFALCSTITTTVAIAVFVAMVASYFALSGVHERWPLGLLFVAPLGVFSLAVFNTSSHWMTRREAFRDISAANLIRSSVSTVTQVLLGLTSGGGLNLIAGRIIGQVLATVFLLVRGELLTRRYWLGSFRATKNIAKRYANFPAYRAPQCAIGLVAEQAPALALGAFFGPSFAGLYWLADRILALPCIVLSENTSKVYYAEATKRYHAGRKLVPFLLKTMFGLASVALLPSIALAIFAPQLLSLLGDRWELAAVFVQWMTLWVFFRFSCAPIMPTYMILEDQRSLLIIDTIAMMLRLPCLLIAGLYGSPLTLVIVVCVFETVKIIVTVIHIIFRLMTVTAIASRSGR
jgi:O-antigen/teichoic acid export membrane protein